VIDFTCLVPGMIGMLVNLANSFGDSRFEKLASKLTKRIFDYMAKKIQSICRLIEGKKEETVL